MKIKKFKPKSRGPFNKHLALIVILLVAVVGTAVLLKSRAEVVYSIPASIPVDCSRDTEAELSTFINSVPTGSTIQFPLKGCFKQENRIRVKDKTNLVIDGNGSTFKKSAQRQATDGGSGYNGNWLILRGHNVTIKNLTAIGAFETPPPRNLGNASNDPGATESNAAFGVYGGDGVTITNVKTRNIWGDGVVTANAAYIDSEPEDFPRNVRVTYSDFRKTFRMCMAPTSGIGIWFEDNFCQDNWYAGIDAELDNVAHPLADLHINRNTFDGFMHYGILIPVAGDNTNTLEIKGNKILTPPDNLCFSSILVGAYPDSNPRAFINVVVEDNEIKTKSTAVTLDHVNGGSISRNKLVEYIDAGCSSPNPTQAFVATNSTRVVIADNGSDAIPTPAPSQTPTPTPSTQPSPTPVPAPTPTSPPTSSSCPTPASFTGASGPDGSDRYDFSWSAAPSASQYNLYYAISPASPSTLYSGPFTTTSASAYSLAAGQQYNFAVRSTCGSALSDNSNVLTVTAPGPVGSQTGLLGDTNHDGKVNFDDALYVIRKWNMADAEADLNKNGSVNFDDALLLIRNWKN